MTVSSKSFPGTEIKTEICFLSGFDKWIVSIYMNGAFWDHREFASEGEARAFFEDPMSEDRPKASKPEILDTSYLDTVDGPWRRLR